MVASAEVCRMNGTKSKGAITQRGKAIASRNATKHGLLAEKPPILATEDLETFQGLVQNLVNDYQPEGAVEWHLVQTIAMCIQRQNRLWVAEAAIGNAQLLPAVAKPYTDEKYPAFHQPQEDERWSHYHPTNLRREHQLLTWFVNQNSLNRLPSNYRSPDFATFWKDWVESTLENLRRLTDEYPISGVARKPDPTLAILNQEKYFSQHLFWLKDLYAVQHPFAECWFYAAMLKGRKPPKGKRFWEDYVERHAAILAVCQQRIEQIEQIEQEMQQERDRYQQDLASHQALTANPIPQQVALLSRYESHIFKQLEKAIDQLQRLQKERKHQVSMGSFGKTAVSGVIAQSTLSADPMDSDTRLDCA
jgi:hypothetical protein